MPTVTVIIYAPLSTWLGLTDSASRVLLDQDIRPGENLRGILCRLAEKYPSFKEMVLDPTNASVRTEVALFLNKEHVADTQGYDSPLGDGDEIMLLPYLGGG